MASRPEALDRRGPKRTRAPGGITRLREGPLARAGANTQYATSPRQPAAGRPPASTLGSGPCRPETPRPRRPPEPRPRLAGGPPGHGRSPWFVHPARGLGSAQAAGRSDAVVSRSHRRARERHESLRAPPPRPWPQAKTSHSCELTPPRPPPGPLLCEAEGRGPGRVPPGPPPSRHGATGVPSCRATIAAVATGTQAAVGCQRTVDRCRLPMFEVGGQTVEMIRSRDFVPWKRGTNLPKAFRGTPPVFCLRGRRSGPDPCSGVGQTRGDHSTRVQPVVAASSAPVAGDGAGM